MMSVPIFLSGNLAHEFVVTLLVFAEKRNAPSLSLCALAPVLTAVLEWRHARRCRRLSFNRIVYNSSGRPPVG